ncbi:MAG TPA: SpoIVB peptidase S55 domain-containing protein [Nocardioides sp.]|uniref:SpoIVB peptidase S55 domain-containing protein n=1 Tax=Nocardioides sp. TaxID=35761 RepID=UPI002BA23676|nr:SpoIVB peptidase S55 domain-containing protein [Nocardioides sp.]HTW14103.1 SpoIVB peptidase S55 domain-containing protein [Nocardioides sp.]
MSVFHRRQRLVSLATAATLALGLPAVGATLLAGPAQSAPPAEDCAVPFPVDEIATGDPVTGDTVVRGTTPTGFTGEILGVVEDGIGPDVPMIMAELDMPEFDRTGGIWQGMSGSPVYAANGELIGAVAYGLAVGPSPIAGITPFELMDDYLPAAAPRRVAVGKATARTLAARAGISTDQASRGFRELPMPMGVTGVTARRLAQLQAKLPKLVERSTYVLGRAASAAPAAETIVAGGNLGVSASYGDVTMAGVGTATSVCGGRVVGFGHPMALLGATTMGLHPADAIYVQPDPVSAPFKVANIAPAVGTVTDDRLTGVTGTFGALPAAASITSKVTYGPRSRTGTTAVSVQDLAAEISLLQLVANQDRVVDGASKGTSLLSWTITGVEAGKPFTLSYTDRWTGSDLSFETSLGVAELVAHLISLDDVTIRSVSASANVTDDLRRHTLVAVEQRRAGQWVRVTRRAPAIGRAGKTIRLRAVVGGRAGRKVVPLKRISIPKRARGVLMLVAQGGDGAWNMVSGERTAQIGADFAKQLRHDQVRVQVGTANKVDLGSDGDLEDLLEMLGRKRVSFVQTQTSAPLAHVVGGSKTLSVIVR